MKKQLLSILFALTSLASLSGMNPDGPLADRIPNQEPVDKPSLAPTINSALKSHDWHTFSGLVDAYGAWYIWRVFSIDMDEFKKSCSYDDQGRGLLSFYLQKERMGPSDRILLQQLIVNGLDLEIKKDGKYVFEQYGERFLDIFAPIAACNFKKPLSAEFKQAYQAYKARCENEKHALKAAEQAQQQVNVENHNRRVQAERRAFLLQKIKKPLLYTGLGVAVLVAACIIYKKCIKRAVDAPNDEENDENQQEVQKA